METQNQPTIEEGIARGYVETLPNTLDKKQTELLVSLVLQAEISAKKRALELGH